MKRKALEEVISRHLHNLKKHSDGLPGAFDPEDIHDLRVEYKKTRAFLRLLQMEKSAGDRLLPFWGPDSYREGGGLKALYQSCGKVRDLQLFLNELETRNLTVAFPGSITRWEQQLFTNKEKTVKAIEALHFNKTLNGITNELPRQLQDETVARFMQQKIATIHMVVLVADDEKDLHTVRKQIKDIVYVMRLYEKDWAIPFPADPWKSEKELNDLASTLGDFNDRCLTVSLLQAGYDNVCNAVEKDKLFEVYKEELQKMETQKIQLLQEVRLLGS